MRNPNGQLEIRVSLSQSPGSTPLRSGVEGRQTAAYGPSEQIKFCKEKSGTV